MKYHILSSVYLLFLIMCSKMFLSFLLFCSENGDQEIDEEDDNSETEQNENQETADNFEQSVDKNEDENEDFDSRYNLDAYDNDGNIFFLFRKMYYKLYYSYNLFFESLILNHIIIFLAIFFLCLQGSAGFLARVLFL